MKTEIELLRDIANEAKAIWFKAQLPLEAITLKNLLTDWIDFKARAAEDIEDDEDDLFDDETWWTDPNEGAR